MRQRPQLLLLFLLLAGSFLLAARAHADTIVVPNEDAATEGNSHYTTLFTLNSRTQQVMAAGEFTSQGVTSPIHITGVQFRRNHTQDPYSSVSIPRTRFDLSTTSATPTSISHTLADNVGADNTTVYGAADGSLLTVSSVGTGTPNPFDIAVVFTTPFLYDPNLGNLLLDVRTFLGPALSIDAFASGVDDQLGVVYTSVGGTTAFFHYPRFGFATEFTFVPATATPEPGSLVLFGGALAAGFVWYRRKRTPENDDPAAQT